MRPHVFDKTSHTRSTRPSTTSMRSCATSGKHHLKVVKWQHCRIPSDHNAAYLSIRLAALPLCTQLNPQRDTIVKHAVGMQPRGLTIAEMHAKIYANLSTHLATDHMTAIHKILQLLSVISPRTLIILQPGAAECVQPFKYGGSLACKDDNCHIGLR